MRQATTCRSGEAVWETLRLIPVILRNGGCETELNPFVPPTVRQTALLGVPPPPPDLTPEWDKPVFQMGKTLTLRAHYDQLTGYGQLATGLLRELVNRNRPCQGIPMAKPWEPVDLWGEAARIDPLVRPLLFDEKGKPRRKNEEGWEMLMASPHHEREVSPCIHLSMWESNRLPDGAVAKLNAKQAIIVPSEWQLLSWDAAGVRRPMYKVNLPISDCFREYRPMPLTGPFTFGMACRRAHGGLRKGVLQAVECFQKAFPKRNDVRLRLKFYPDCPTTDIDAYRSDKRIEVISEAYTEEQVADFLASLHVYVSTSQAEGYGLVQCQAMGIGRPVIGAKAHAQAEYLTESNAFLAYYDLRDALDVNPENGYYQGFVFPVANESLIHLMRVAFENPQLALAKGAQAHSQAKGMIWGKFLNEVLDVLKREGMPC